MSRGLPRVLVLTGTSDHPFPRLLDILPTLVEGGVASEVRVQSRVPPRAAPGLVPLGMLSRDALERELADADVVVTHGGSGSCFDAIRAGHRPIVVARRVAHGELLDDHQVDVATELERSGVAVLAADPLSESLPRHVGDAWTASRAAPRPPLGLGGRLRSLWAGATRGVPPNGRARAIRVERVDASTYTAHYATCLHAHPLQSVAWGEARRSDGWTPEWWVASLGAGRSLAGAQVLRRANPLLPGYVPYGPTTDGSADGRRAGRSLLRSLARRSAVGILWAPCPGPAADGGSEPADSVALAPPSRTGFVALGTDDEMLARMRGTWRWELRRALRDPRVTVRWHDPASLAGPLLSRVHELARAKGFRPPIGPDVAAAFAAGARASGVELLALTVETDGTPTNTWIASVVDGWAQTLWTHHEADAGAGSGRVALWALLRASRDRGARWYDVSGIDEENNPGVASFKAGVRPEAATVPGLRWIAPACVPGPIARAAGGAWRRVRYGREAGRLFDPPDPE